MNVTVTSAEIEQLKSIQVNMDALWSKYKVEEDVSRKWFINFLRSHPNIDNALGGKKNQPSAFLRKLSMFPGDLTAHRYAKEAENILNIIPGSDESTHRTSDLIERAIDKVLKDS